MKLTNYLLHYTKHFGLLFFGIYIFGFTQVRAGIPQICTHPLRRYLAACSRTVFKSVDSKFSCLLRVPGSM